MNFKDAHSLTDLPARAGINPKVMGVLRACVPIVSGVRVLPRWRLTLCWKKPLKEGGRKCNR